MIISSVLIRAAKRQALKMLVGHNDVQTYSSVGLDELVNRSSTDFIRLLAESEIVKLTARADTSIADLTIRKRGTQGP